MSLQLRPAKVSDAQTIARLGRDSFTEAFGLNYQPQDLLCFLDSTYTKAIQVHELSDPSFHYRLAFIDDEPVGFALLREGTLESCVEGPSPIELQRLYLLRVAHGSGASGALMTWCIQHAVEIGKRTLWLGVWEHNARGQAFYAKWGFTRVGQHTFKVGSQADVDFILVKDLQS
jgi:diamine N-acetyltransferase